MSDDDASLIPQEMFFYIIVGIIFTGMIFFLIFGIGTFKDRLVKTPPQLEAELLSLRFTSLPECFAYKDEKGIMQPGILDAQKFNQDVLDKCYFTVRKQGFKSFSFRLQLQGADKELMTNHYKLNDRDDFTLIRQVLLRNSSGQHEDVLTIYVQHRLEKMSD